MRPGRGWLGIMGLSLALPVAFAHAQSAPEAAGGKPAAAAVKAKKPKIVLVDEAAQQPKPVKVETPPLPSDANKPTKPGPDTTMASPAPVAPTVRKAKSKRASKAESEVASAQPAPAAPPPPPPAAAPKLTPAQPPPARPSGPSCALEEAEQPRGGRLDVLGSGFGQAPVVRIDQKPVRQIERRTDRISVQVPPDSDGGVVTLQSDGQSTSCGHLVIIGKNR